MAVPRVDGFRGPVCVLEVKGVVVDDGRELQQRAVVELPAHAQRGIELPPAREEPGAGEVVAVERPGTISRNRPWLGRRGWGRGRRGDRRHSLMVVHGL